jgi:hypothetical protein
MNFDDWFEAPERSQELAQLVARAERESSGDKRELLGRIIYYALELGWTAAMEHRFELRGDGAKPAPH